MLFHVPENAANTVVNAAGYWKGFNKEEQWYEIGLASKYKTHKFTNSLTINQ